MARPANIFNINLDDGVVSSEPFTDELVQTVLGGFGFNTWHLYKNLPGETGALDPGNILMISPGLLTGSAAPASSRVHISAKSPLSGLMGSSNVGGRLGARLHSLNTASLIISGRAAAPSYLLVDETGVSLHARPGLWGMDTRRTEAALREKHASPFTEILTIGVAGENRTPYACIMCGEDHAAGRTGLGAVMGSKNLKAIVVEGVKRKEKTDSAAKAIIREYVSKIKNASPVYDDFSGWGSAGHITPLNEAGQLGTRNYREGVMENAHEIDGKNLKKFVRKKTSCHRCPVHCKATIKLEAGRHRGFTGGRPEYETVINMGSLCGLSDPGELLYLSNLANILGLDAISTGSVIAFAMDLYDRGILTPADTGGLALTWGNAEAMEQLMKMIAGREEGLGEILARGVKRASEIIGKGSGKYAYHTKGVEIYGADPRGAQAMALTYAVSLRGGDFTSVYPIPAFRYSPEMARRDFGTEASIDPLVTEGKGALIRGCLLVSAVIDSLGLCKVPALSIIGRFDLENESRLVKAFAGVDLSPRALFRVGERIIAMEKLFNIAHGATAEDDNLPGMFQNEKLENAAVKGEIVHGLRAMVRDFYRLMDWNERGAPTRELMARLNL
ncbi:MAG: aldehyde ferredoxin oxidoreductase family protein [Desulfobacterales bacterium]|nr:aldehyde ferredoxin oxidoreductase family protein [Desulfobacterales bacterium]